MDSWAQFLVSSSEVPAKAIETGGFDIILISMGVVAAVIAVAVAFFIRRRAVKASVPKP
jgi:hypothetical protein